MGLIWFLHFKSSSIFGTGITIFFSPKSRLSLEITPPRIQQISEILCPWIKRPEEKTTVDSSTELSILILCSHLRLRLPSGFFPSFFSPKPCMYSYRLPCVSHSPTSSFSFISSSLLCFQEVHITKGLKWKFRSSGIWCRVIWWDTSLCRIFRPPITTFLVGPGIFLSILFQNMLSPWFFQKGFTPMPKQTTLWQLFLSIPTKCT